MNFFNHFLRSKIFDNFNVYLIKKFLKVFKFFFVETNFSKLYNVDQDLENSKIYKKERYHPYISYSHLSDLFEIIHNQKQKLFFFDYGAGNLNLYYYLNRKFKNIKYYFKDQSPIEQKVRKIIHDEEIKNLLIGEDFIDQEIDLLYFGSSIQYIENYKNALALFFKKTKYILIAQTPFFENIKLEDKIIIKQLNMHPNINFLYIFNFNSFIKFMHENNYELVEKNINKVTKFLNFKNFDKKKYKDLNMYDLLFRFKDEEKK